MKKHYLSAFLAFCFTYTAVGQGVALQLGIGTTQFLGDLGGKPTYGTNDPSDLDLQTVRYVTTAGFRFNVNTTLGFRVSGALGKVSGADKYTTNRERRLRNLSFFSPIAEGSVTAQLNFGESKRIYVFGGIGFFKFNPKTKLNGQVYELQKYGTEGQYFMANKKPYSLTSMSIPFGIGYKLWSTDNGYFSVEYAFRKSNTDYIDDVSTNYADPVQLAASNGAIAVQLADRSTPGVIPGFSSPGAIRGDSKNLDNFSFFTFNYNILLNGPRGSSFYRGGKRRGKTKCPDMSF